MNHWRFLAAVALAGFILGWSSVWRERERTSADDMTLGALYALQIAAGMERGRAALQEHQGLRP